MTIKNILTLIAVLVIVGIFLFPHFQTKSTLEITPHISSEGFRVLPYDKQVEEMLKLADDNPEEAWNFLKETFIINGNQTGNVHDLSHTVGNKAFQKFGINGIKICDSSFAYGCFHGVTEEMLLTEGIAGLKSIENACGVAFPSKDMGYISCIHGTGHGVYGVDGGDLKKALLDCDIIEESYRQYCWDGVFMERSFSPENTVFDPKNPWKFCSDLDSWYQRNCARYHVQSFISSTPSLNSVGKYCGRGSTQILQETCYESLGYHIAETSFGREAEIVNSCNKMPNKDGVEICIMGGAKETVFQKYSGFETSGNALCQRLSISRRFVCLSDIKT